MKKLISMSVWGSNPRYIVGAKRQIELARKHLSDWDVRIYTDNFNNFKLIQDIDVVICKNSSAGMYWRFFPLFEDDYDIVASRDSDSRFSMRECKAMEEFANSDKIFHVIRDHESHFQFPIMAGLFACKGKLDNHIKDQLLEYMNQNTSYLCDQNFLRDYVWPVVKENTLVHCLNDGWFKESRETLKNRFSFCGNGYDENDMPLYPPTLNECVGFDPNRVSEEYKFDEGSYE